MVDFTAHLGKYTKIKQLSRKISQFRQILVFTAKFLSLPLGGAAKFFTAKWQLNSANFSLFGGEFRSSGIAAYSFFMCFNDLFCIYSPEGPKRRLLQRCQMTGIHRQIPKSWRN